ncbi:MAG TPA: site-specific integrase, partial [Polyangiaceae bacterium]|nr:site-specific integrase [Polyangiaceae bacterium]
YVAIHQSINLETGELKATKTGMARKVPIRPALLALLKAMHAEAEGAGRVIQHTHDNKLAEHGMPPTEDLAATLREHLERAEVERADLYADRPTSKRVTFYDLRASGITWEVLDGTEPLRIQQRAGHTNFSTTQVYIREAEALGEAVGVPFGELPESLLAEADDSQVVDLESSGVSSDAVELFVDPAAFLPDPLASPRGFEPHGTAENTLDYATTRSQKARLPPCPEWLTPRTLVQPIAKVIAKRDRSAAWSSCPSSRLY